MYFEHPLNKMVDKRQTISCRNYDTCRLRTCPCWKSDLSHRIHQDFFQAVAVYMILYGFTTWTQTKCLEKKLDGKYTRMEATPHKTADVRPLASLLTNHSIKTNKI